MEIKSNMANPKSIMIQACLSDEFPDNMETLKTFMFDRCRTEEEMSHLLGIWIDLIKLHPRFSREQLQQAVQEKTLVSYILKMYESYHPQVENYSYYFRWFKLNIERFLL